jgi:hypothetical protein
VSASRGRRKTGFLVGFAFCAAAALTGCSGGGDDSAAGGSSSEAGGGAVQSASRVGPLTLEALKDKDQAAKILFDTYQANGIDLERTDADVRAVGNLDPIDTPEKVDQYVQIVEDAVKTGGPYQAASDVAKRQRWLDWVWGYAEKGLGGEFSFS